MIVCDDVEAVRPIEHALIMNNLQALLEHSFKVKTKFKTSQSNPAIFELEVALENQTKFSITDLKLEAGSNQDIQLLTLPFFDKVRQLGRLEPYQTSQSQLFRYRWNQPFSISDSTILELRVNGLIESKAITAFVKVIF